MGEKDTQLGIITLIVAAFFLFMGLDMFRVDVVSSFNQGISTFIAFILVASGVYLITKK